MSDMTCTREVPPGGEENQDDCTEYFLDRNYWSMIKDSPKWDDDSEGHQPEYFQAYWDDYHGYHQVHHYESVDAESCEHDM